MIAITATTASTPLERMDIFIYDAYDDSSLSHEHVFDPQVFFFFLFTSISLTIINYGHYSLQVTTTTTFRSGAKGPMTPVLTQTRKKGGKEMTGAWEGDDDRVTGA
jgi:hypothetical protein